MERSDSATSFNVLTSCDALIQSVKRLKRRIAKQPDLFESIARTGHVDEIEEIFRQIQHWVYDEAAKAKLKDLEDFAAFGARKKG